MSTALDVINNALMRLGDSPVETLDDLDSQLAQLCQRKLPIIRDAILRSHPWNFALFQDSLSPMSPSPLFHWTYNFAWPTNPYCLRVWRVENDLPFVVASERVPSGIQRVIRADDAPLNLEYIGRVEDITLWDPQAVQLLEECFKAELAMAVTGQQAKEKASYEIVIRDWLEATRSDGQEGLPQVLKVNATLLQARRVRGGLIGAARWLA